LKQEEAMLSQVKYNDLPSYRLESEKGKEQGEMLALQKLPVKRLGSIPTELTAKVAANDIADSERWFDKAIDAG
jgi:hypothetical protein